MGPIEWLLVVEGILLVVAGICGSTAYFSRPVNQDPDAFLRAMMGFWRTVVARRLVLDPVSSGRLIEVEEDADDHAVEVTFPRSTGSKKNVGSAMAAESSPVLRGGTPVPSVAVCTFGVTVVPKSKTNDILGREPGGLRIAVIGAADDAVANKLVLAIVAREFGIKPYQVTLTRGHFAATKAVRIAGLSQEDAERLLRKFPVV